MSGKLHMGMVTQAVFERKTLPWDEEAQDSHEFWRISWISGQDEDGFHLL